MRGEKRLDRRAQVDVSSASVSDEALTGAVHDHLHEPYRLENIPGAADAIRAGIDAGAYTGWLSGSGSSVLCACSANTADAVAEAMKAAFAEVDLTSVARDLSADNSGLCIVSKS